MHFFWRIAQFLELRWWQFYLRKKPVASYLDWKKKYWLTFLQRTRVSIAPGSRVLDAGCGPAGIFIILGDYQTDALDPLLDTYALSLRHFDRSWYPNTAFYSTPLENFTPTEKYDFIFCLNAINHVSDIQKCMAVLSASLADGGTLILSIDAHKYNIIKWLFKVGKGDALHPQQYSKQDYIQMATASGLLLKETLLYDDGVIFQYYVLNFLKKF